ncbi:ATP synthase subunit e, mitochondrial [Colletotrichum tanaceti]|uniref:ATP synthase F(0) complex subunit e, mitochondrial n=1 Tax=Colletotrichum tanaceti TaxID=1306861 RepID=A0A4U6XJP8_9PEZI|nr:ATP synthase subunit e, mitochondrial [Colletotrichum tanaceti]TKW55662.1 ATP synthase subunit e, mitochondrial [Colletotrichum tanaceti]
MPGSDQTANQWKICEFSRANSHIFKTSHLASPTVIPSTELRKGQLAAIVNPRTVLPIARSLPAVAQSRQLPSMSSSSGVNVLRYTALGLGVFYGFTHQRSITASQKAAAAAKEYERKEKLIEQAKAEFAKKNQPLKTAAADAGANVDPMDPKFDLEAYFNNLVKQNP